MQRPVLTVETAPRRQVLPNGAILLTRPMREVHGIAVAVVIESGTRDEDDSTRGISHLLEHMVFKGTKRRTAFDLARDMEAIGGQLDAYTTKEHTAYTLKVLPSQLPAAVDILSDMLEHSTFPADQLELEKQVVVEEILSSEDTPDDFVHERFAERLWPVHPLRHPILGTEESVRGITREDLDAWQSRVHVGGNIILAAAGAITPREEDVLAQGFTFAPGKFEFTPQNKSEFSPGVWCHSRESLSQQYVELGVPSLPVAHPDRYPMSLLSNILGGGMSSRLFQKVREERGLTYGIYNYVDFYRDSGTLATSFSASPDNCQEALDLVAGEYKRLREGDLDEEEMELNKAQLLSSVVLGLEGTLSQTMRSARSEMLYQRFVPVNEILDAIESIRREDVIRLAETFLDLDRQTVVGYGPLSELKWSK